MKAANKKLLRQLSSRPADIAVRCGYDKLTPLHNAWIHEMVFGHGDVTLQAHRGSFKTTCVIVALADIVLLHPDERTIFIRKTDTDVAEVMSAVAALLKHPWYQAMSEMLYGTPLKVTNDTKSEVDTSFKAGVSGAPQVLGLGCGGSITGKHAHQIFTDDIVNMKDRVSAAERERIKLLYMELQNVRIRGGRIVNTGTPWHKDDAFQLMPNIERHDCYTTGLMTKDEIAKVKASMSRSMFAANYELKHVADEDAMFGEPEYFSDERLLYDGIAHVDAAYGGEDGTALTIIKEHKGIYYSYGKLWPATAVDKVLPEILAIVRTLRAGTIWCEQNADKGYVRKAILKMGHPCASYAESTNKYIKIATYLKGAWPQVRILDSEAHPLDAEYVNQILDYNENAAHDDAPDSMASLVRRLTSKPGSKGYREGI